jgi:hypothetical protein
MRLARLLIVALALPLFAGSSHHGPSYVLRLGSTTFMNGDGMSISELTSLQNRYGKRFFWFRQDGKTYIAYDALAIDRATAITRPQQELGAKQGELGSKQGELGAAQARLGAQQAAIGSEQASHGLSDSASARLEKRQEELSARQEELSRRQEVMSKEQERLSEQQEALSRETEKKLSALADELIRSGAAKEVSR